jgi:restriction system protein
MPIPDLFTITLPLLKKLSDSQEHSLNDLIDALAVEFKLTEEEKNEMLPSGSQQRFRNRVGWARSELVMGRLIEITGWGKVRITERGMSVLQSDVHRIDRKFLRQFPEYAAKLNRQGQESKQAEKEEEADQTPLESIEASYQNIRRELARELIDRIKSCSPRFFEQLVVDLLVAMGYGGSRSDAGQAVGQSGDGGIDGIIKEDKLGLDVVYIQAKRWEGSVGRPVVQAFAGSIEGRRARKGVLITTSHFTQDAKQYVQMIEKKIVLIDGEELAQLMIDYGVGVTQVASYAIKKMDIDYFGDG